MTLPGKCDESVPASSDETLPDRLRFGLTAEQWEAFQSSRRALLCDLQNY